MATTLDGNLDGLNSEGTGNQVDYLEDHPRTCKWLGSPPFISNSTAIWKGNNPT